MRKLVDIFNTKYFPAHYCQDLRYFIDLACKCLEDRNITPVSDVAGVLEAIEHFRSIDVVELDLAEALFVPDSIAIVQASTERGVILCDSNNRHRDAILLENRRRSKLSYATTTLPELQSLNDLPDYIGKLREDIVYTVGSMPLQLAIPIIAITTIFNPDVQFDLENHYDTLFKYVRSNVVIEEQEETEYTYILGSTIYTDKFVDGKIYIQGTGDMTFEKFYKEFLALPASYGRVRLSENKEWELLKYSAIDDIKSYMLQQSIKITDLFPRRSD